MTRRPSSFVRWAVALTAAIAAPAAWADVLLTTDGRLLEGVGRFESGGVVFVQRTGPNVRLELSRIAYWSRSQPRLVRGVRLRSGEAVVGEVIRLTDRGLVLRGNEGSHPFDRAPAEQTEVQTPWPLARIAEIVLDGDKLPPSAAGSRVDAPGALLANGDYVEGELVQLSAERVTLSSVLFGERTFARPGPVVALRLASLLPPPRPATARSWRISLADGTVATTDSLRLAPQDSFFRFTDAAGRSIGADANDLAELLLPAAISAVDCARVRTSGPLDSGVPLRLRGVAPWAGIVPNLAAAYPIKPGPAAHLDIDPAGADALYFRLGLPEGLMPNLRGRFAIEVDGERVARTAFVTSVDAALRVGVRVSGKSRVTIRLEAEEGAALPPEGVLSDLLAVKAP